MNIEEIIKDTVTKDSAKIAKKITENINYSPNDNTELISNLIKFVDVLKWPLLILIIVLIFKKKFIRAYFKSKKDWTWRNCC